MAETQASQKALVELVVYTLGIVQQLTAAGNHHKQATTRSVVVLVGGQVLSKVVSTATWKPVEPVSFSLILKSLTLISLIVVFISCLLVDFSWLRQIDLRGGRMIPCSGHFASQISFRMKK